MKWYTKETYINNDIRYSKMCLLGKCIFKKEKSETYKKTYFFNKCIKIKELNPPTTNAIGLNFLFSPKPKISYPYIDIIIPVYNGYDYLYKLFTSIIINTDLDYHLIVINDCSPDERVLPELKKWKSQFGSKMTLIENEKNLGFIKTVNSGFALTSNHVVILNTDVILPTKWASRLLRPILIDDSIASVTPFSNAATIFSLPKIFNDNDFAGNIESLNSIFEKWNIPYHQLKFTTGVGFCMAINHDTLTKIGGFDEIYGKGYGEENDWCQRAIQAGFSHTLAGDLFVWHKHGASFNSKEKETLLKKNQAILQKRYPNYQKDTNNSAKNIYFQSIRFFAELFFHNVVIPETIIWFDHSWGGGTELYTNNEFKKLKDDYLLLRIQDYHNNSFLLTYFQEDQKNSIVIRQTEDIKTILDNLNIASIVINNLASYPHPLEILKIIREIKASKNINVSFRLHDFQCVCPSITMMNAQNQYCYCSNQQKCEECFSLISDSSLIKCTNIVEWQNTWKEVIDNTVDDCIVFSHSSHDIITSIFPSLRNKIRILPHSITPLRKVNIKPHKKIHIGILGTMSTHKGLPILKEWDTLLPSYKNVKVTIIGDLTTDNLKNIKLTGKYNAINLPEIMEHYKIDIIFIPSLWPETFSYTTAEAMSMQLLLACFPLGAPAERVSTYTKGLVISKIDAKIALDEIIRFVHTHKSCHES